MLKKIDDLNRIVIPQPVRKSLGIKPNQMLEMEVENNKIIITNPNGIRSREEIEEKIEALKETTEVNELMKDSFIAGLEWVLDRNVK